MRNIKAFIILCLCDAVSICIAFIVSSAISVYISGTIAGSQSVEIFSDSFISRMYIFAVMACVLLFALYNRGHYSRRIPWWNQVRFTAIVIIMLLFADGFVHFAIKNQFSRVWVFLGWVLTFLFILVGRVISRLICEKMQLWSVPTVIIGSGDNAIDTMFAINSDNYTGYNAVTLILHSGYKDFDRVNLPINYSNINIIDGQDDYADYINNHAGNFYIIAPDALSDIDIETLVATINNIGAAYAIVPPVKGLSLYGNTPQYFFGHDIMFMQPRPKIKSPFGRVVKRVMDIVGSVILLVVLAPLFLLIALLIKREGGSIFFLNKRLGKDGQEFYCLKFRTMMPNAEQVLQQVLAADASKKLLWETHRKIKNDPRITKIGKFLRKLSLDELPQLFNIIKGEMSMVGPRPILPDETKFFDKIQLQNYYSVRPGITGLWQVSGRNNTTFRKRVHLDSWYVNNWSIWYDIVIILKTFTVIARRSGAY